MTFGYVSQSTSLVVRLCDTDEKAERGQSRDVEVCSQEGLKRGVSMTKARRTKQEFKSHIVLHHSSVMLKICNLFLSLTDLFFFSKAPSFWLVEKKY